MSEYVKRIDELTSNIHVDFIDFTQPRDKASIPTQVSSEFITNREQGDWAEELLVAAINKTSKNHVAVKYGKSDDTVAGEAGFNDFFESYQEELDRIGKRPDLLIFKKKDFDENLGYDISKIDHAQIEEYVKKAVAGIEVRSSAFLYDRYEIAMADKVAIATSNAIAIKDEILSNFKEELSLPSRSQYIRILESITPETISDIDFRVPSWRSDARLAELSSLLKNLKANLKELQKRTYLSITPKVEDIKVVYKWIKTFQVPHYYFQVFFDKVYGISFEKILQLISNPDNDGCAYFLESDVKNQNKTTIKIKSNIGSEIASKVDEPEHYSQRKEMSRGRLLFYVCFKGGEAYLNIGNLSNTLGIPINDF